MLATYMRRMRNNNLNNLEIRIAGSSCLPQLAFWKKKRIGIIFKWDMSTTPLPSAELERKIQKLLSFSGYKMWRDQIWCRFNCY